MSPFDLPKVTKPETEIGEGKAADVVVAVGYEVGIYD
jgi:hypothetical protein